MANKLVLYYMDVSPGARFTLMTIRALGLAVRLQEVDVFKSEHQSPEYVKLNPLREIPTLVHGELVLRDSHAICTYLVSRFAPGSALYPRAPADRARVDQMLCFNMCTFFPRSSAVMKAFFIYGEKTPDPIKAAELSEVYGFLNTFLESSKWLAGDEMTLADICCLSTFCSAEILVPLDQEKYPLTAAWAARMKENPLHQLRNQPGLDRLLEYMRTWDLSKVAQQ